MSRGSYGLFSLQAVCLLMGEALCPCLVNLVSVKHPSSSAGCRVGPGLGVRADVSVTRSVYMVECLLSVSQSQGKL